MKYQGSKSRIAKHILPIILKDRKPGQWYVEPFMGGCNTLDKVANPRLGADAHKELVAMFEALCYLDWTPPDLVTEDDYAAIRQKGTDHLRGYVGFAMSFGGKWWGGYRRDKPGQKNDMGNMSAQSRRAKESALKQRDDLMGTKFIHATFDTLEIPDNSIVYCDPPYKGTTGYRSDFDHDAFWNWCDSLVEKGHTVYVSEYQAPEGWASVWDKPTANALSRTLRTTATERLFTKHNP